MRGRGLLQGLCFEPAELTGRNPGRVPPRADPRVLRAHDQVLKLMPPLTIETELLEAGLERLHHAIADVLYARPAVAVT